MYEQYKYELEAADFKKNYVSIYDETVEKAKSAFLEGISPLIRHAEVMTSNNTKALLAKDSEYLYFFTASVEEFAKTVDRTISNPAFRKTALPLKNILYFKEKGDVQHVSNVQGGGSEDVNYLGAVVGGFLFGMAGVIVGSRAGTGNQPIYTTIESIDSRYSILRYIDKNGETTEAAFEHCFYDAFIKVIPEKDYEQVLLNHSNESSSGIEQKEANEEVIGKIPARAIYAFSVADEIRKFKELKDEGIITVDEFESQKQKLLKLDY